MPAITITPLGGAPAGPRRLALVGNPNVGKSVVFNAFTGRYVTVSNYPGTTVDLSRGERRWGGVTWEIVDTPGTVSLEPRSEDEAVTRRLLLEQRPDVVVQVADAKHLRRTLHLTAEIQAMGIPMVLGLNMADEARDRGLRIDREQLSDILGVPVVETVAVAGEGLYDLFRAAAGGAKVAKPFLNGSVVGVGAGLAPARFEVRDRKIAEIVSRVTEQMGALRSSWAEKLGWWLMRPLPGLAAVAVVLFLLYEVVGVFGAGTAVNFLENVVFGQMLTPAFTRLTRLFLPWPIAQDALVGPYGLLSMGVPYAFAIILPVVTTFFFCFGILEDSGYFPRLSVMMDRVFRMIGLNGKAVLPTVLGLGCDTMATFTTRILDTRKERLVTTVILTMAIPCSAQLGVIMGLLGGLSWWATAVWLAVITSSTLLVGWAADRVIPGARAPFLMEIPPLRRPSFGNILKKVTMRIRWYLREAVPLFLIGTLALFVADRVGLLARVTAALAPPLHALLGLPPSTGEIFVMGFLRRDYGAAGLFNLGKSGALTPGQVVVCLIVITLFVRCIAQFLSVVKEQGWGRAWLITGAALVYALGAGMTVHWGLWAVGIA